MELFGPPISPDVLEEQRASDALVRLIRKWRWMGMDGEAERIENVLATRDTRPADTVIADPRDTD